MKTISSVRFGRHMMAVAVCGLALSTASMLAQDNSGSTSTPSTQGDQGGPGGPGGPGGHGRGGEEHRLERMTKQLNLTPDQVSQVKAIEMDSRTQAKAIHEDTSVAPADKRTKMMEIREAAMTKTRAVLNDEQKTKFDAMQERMKERQNGQDGPPPPPAE